MVSLIFICCLFIFSILFISNKLMKKKGIKINAIITNIVEVEKRSDDDYLINKYYSCDCEFDYNGLQRKKITISSEYADKIKEIGTKVNCIYFPKKDKIILNQPLVNNVELNYKRILIVFLIVNLISFLNTCILGIFKFELLSILSFCDNLFISIFFVMIGYRFYKDSKITNKFLKLNATVKDIFVIYGGESTTYGPILEFNYNGKNIIKKSNKSTSSIKYKKGDNIIVYYNPETDKYIISNFIKSDKMFGIFFMILGILCMFGEFFL